MELTSATNILSYPISGSGSGEEPKRLCHDKATCANTIGSYKCDCISGYHKVNDDACVGMN